MVGWIWIWVYPRALHCVQKLLTTTLLPESERNLWIYRHFKLWCLFILWGSFSGVYGSVQDRHTIPIYLMVFIPSMLSWCRYLGLTFDNKGVVWRYYAILKQLTFSRIRLMCWEVPFTQGMEIVLLVYHSWWKWRELPFGKSTCSPVGTQIKGADRVVPHSPLCWVWRLLIASMPCAKGMNIINNRVNWCICNK